MSNNTRQIVQATKTVVEMDRDDLERLALEMLISNPSIVVRALTVEEGYAIVFRKSSYYKIPHIRFVRHIRGMGLSDAKWWVEGKSCEGHECGVLMTDIPAGSAARMQLNDLRRMAVEFGVRDAEIIELVKMSELDKFKYIP